MVEEAETFFFNTWWSSSKKNLLPDEMSWIKSTYEDPEHFFSQLLAKHGRNYPWVKTEYEHCYDFYSDCIFGAINFNQSAFTFYDSSLNAIEYNYLQLHQCINEHVKQWHHLGIQAGDTVCITLSFGIEFIIGFFAALRFGLHIFWLPVHEGSLPIKRVEKLVHKAQCPYLICLPNTKWDLAPDAVVLNVDLSLRNEQNFNPETHLYKPSDVVLSIINLTDTQPMEIMELTASELYHGALRDGLLFGLQPGTKFAIPLENEILVHPISVMAAFLRGAHFVHVDQARLVDHPTLLQNSGIQVVKLSKKLQELWSHQPCVPTSLKYICKNTEQRGQQTWNRFVEVNRLDKVLVSHLEIDASKAGIIFASKPQVKTPDSFLLPNLGLQWTLGSLVAGQANSNSSYGTFEIKMSQKSASQANAHITLIDDYALYSGTQEPVRGRLTYPCRMVEEEVTKLDFVSSAMVLPIKEAGDVGKCSIILIVFMGSTQEGEQSKIKEVILEKIQTYIGTEYVPDKIECFDFVASMKGNEIDRDWIKEQYLSGDLHKKAKMPVFRVLSAIRGALLLG